MHRGDQLESVRKREMSRRSTRSAIWRRAGEAPRTEELREPMSPRYSSSGQSHTW